MKSVHGQRLLGRQSGSLICGLTMALLVSGCNGGNDGGPAPGTGNPPTGGGSQFRAASTFRVAAPGQVAEIVAATPDGNTLIYTDSEAEQLGFVNISNPDRPVASGSLPVNGEPTSVTVTRDGRYALAVINDGMGRLAVVDLNSKTEVRSFRLGGQPDSIAISPDGRFAAIAIENERSDEDAALPQAPGGSLVVVNLTGLVGEWTTRTVSLANLPNTRFPTDPEPEFIDINNRNEAAVTLQENNAIAIVNLASGSVIRTFSAGAVTQAADITSNGKAEFTGRIVNSRREPDGIAWTPRGNLVTANEGDYDLDLKDGEFVGGRNFTVFSPTGQVIFDPGAELEKSVAQAGLYPDNRSGSKGTEPENVEIGTFAGQSFLFVALERADALAVYRLDNDARPQFVQLLRTGDAPEGVIAIPGRNLVVTANEGDGTLSIFRQ